MKCLKCNEAEYATVEAEKCPKCGDMIFTHDQSVKLDQLRLSVNPGMKIWNEEQALNQADMMLEAAQDYSRGGTRVKEIRSMIAARLKELTR
jgi:hypothetical protein